MQQTFKPIVQSQALSAQKIVSSLRKYRDDDFQPNDEEPFKEEETTEDEITEDEQDYTHKIVPSKKRRLR